MICVIVDQCTELNGAKRQVTVTLFPGDLWKCRQGLPNNLHAVTLHRWKNKRCEKGISDQFHEERLPKKPFSKLFFSYIFSLKTGKVPEVCQSLWNHTQYTLNRIIIVILILHTVYNHIVSKYSLFLFSSQTLSVSLGGQSRPLLLDLDPLTDAFVATSRSLFASQAINTSLTLLLKHTHCPPLRVSSDSKQNP